MAATTQVSHSRDLKPSWHVKQACKMLTCNCQTPTEEAERLHCTTTRCCEMTISRWACISVYRIVTCKRCTRNAQRVCHATSCSIMQNFLPNICKCPLCFAGLHINQVFLLHYAPCYRSVPIGQFLCDLQCMLWLTRWWQLYQAAAAMQQGQGCHQPLSHMDLSPGLWRLRPSGLCLHDRCCKSQHRKHRKNRPMPDACCWKVTDHAKGHSIDWQALTDCCHPKKGILFSDRYLIMLKWTKKTQLLVKWDTSDCKLFKELCTTQGCVPASCSSSGTDRPWCCRNLVL